MNRSPLTVRRRLAAAFIGATLVASACGSSDDSADTADAPADTVASTDAGESTESTEAPATTEAASDGVRRVPGDYPTIQEAVDAADPGDLVLIEPGVYNEAVDVSTDELTIRGLDRNGVILDGEFELENGVRILGADGVAVENMTAINYTTNGFYWIEADGYRGSYLTSQRTGNYGIYAFDSVNGVIEHSYAAGSPDSGLYIGQCNPCNALVNDVWMEWNGLGYSGTNSGGNLTIVNSQFNDNRAGIVPSSGTYELCYPGRDTTIIGNVVLGNSNAESPAKSIANLAFGTGITVAGSSRNIVERNLVADHERAGIAIAPYPEDNPNDLIPSQDEWDTPCDVQREQPLSEVTPDDLVAGTFLVWDPYFNRVVDNDVSGSGIADLVNSGFDAPTEELGNCFSGNTFSTSQPASLETLAPCEGEGSGDWSIDAFDPVQIVTFEPPEGIDYQIAALPPLPQLPGMDDPANAPANPAVGLPGTFDTSSIARPTGPLFETTG